MTDDIPALWQIMMPQAVPHAIPDGVGRMIRDKEMGAQKHRIRPKGHRPPPVDGRTAYEMLPWGIVCNKKRKRGAVTSKLCAVLMKGPANHSDIITCLGTSAEDRRAVRNGLKYLLDNEQIRRFLEDAP